MYLVCYLNVVRNRWVPVTELPSFIYAVWLAIVIIVLRFSIANHSAADVFKSVL